MYKKAFYVLATLVLSFSGTSFLLAVSRGSGAYTSRLRLYSPAQYEDSGWGTDASTNSIRVNNSILDTRIGNLELIGDNTNYVNLSASTETKTGGLYILGAIGGGVTDPTAPLDVRTNPGAEGIVIRARSNLENISGLIFKDSAGSSINGTFQVSTGSFLFGSVANAPMLFYTNNTERMNLSSAGKLGISTQTPQYQFHVIGDTAFTSSATVTTPAHGEGLIIRGRPSDNVGGLIFKNNTGSSNLGTFQVDAATFLFGSIANADMAFYTNNVERMVLSKNGNLKLFQQTDCENQTPNAVGEFCAQNSATCPVAISTGTALAAFACVTLGAP